MTASEILWYDWDWIEDTLSRIARDQMHNRFFELESQMAVAMAQNGQPEKYQTMRDNCLTEEDRERIEANEIKRVRKVKGSVVPKRVVKVPSEGNNDGAG